MIWKCASGGYHSGQSCQEEFQAFRTRFKSAEGNDLSDIQLVRAVERDELINFVKDELGVDLLPYQVDAMLNAMVSLTPTGTDKKSWDKIHGR